MPIFFNNYFQDWLKQNPNASSLIAILNWSVNHPWLSVLFAIFSLVIIGKIVKGLDRLFEITGLSLLKALFKSIWSGFKAVIINISKLTGWGLDKVFLKSDRSTVAVLETSVACPAKIEKQHRLQEIKTRLEAINQEQNELIKEASELLNEETSIVIVNKQ